jgi:hypothetical protein
MSLAMWVYVFKVTNDGTEQTLYCDIGDVAGTLEDKFCVYMQDENLYVSLSDAPDAATTAGTVYPVDTGVDMVEGWNLIGVSISYDATVGAEKTQATAYVVNDDNTAVTNGGTVDVIPTASLAGNLAQFTDDASYTACVGGRLSGTGAPYTSRDPLMGAISQAKMYDTVLGAADINGLYTTTCTGYCEICPADTGACFTSTNPTSVGD